MSIGCSGTPFFVPRGEGRFSRAHKDSKALFYHVGTQAFLSAVRVRLRVLQDLRWVAHLCRVLMLFLDATRGLEPGAEFARFKMLISS